MDNAALLFLVESVLDKGQSTSKGNYAFKCPFCSHHKNKLEINLRTTDKRENFWHCWICGVKGKTLLSLFKKIKAPSDKIAELNILIVPSKYEKHTENSVLELPKEFISLSRIDSLDKLTQIEAKHALISLKKRGITQDDIIKYNIGFCKDGPYNNRVIIPSYDNNKSLNYFIARAYDDSDRKYKNPPVAAKDAIGWELYINWDAPIILVEGIFDALTIKRNVIPLFGKVLHDKLMKRLVESSVNRIYIALDKDARKDALKQAEKLMSYGKEVYMVEMDGKDANEIGFEHFLDIIEQTQPLTFSTLINKKIELI